MLNLKANKKMDHILKKVVEEAIIFFKFTICIDYDCSICHFFPESLKEMVNPHHNKKKH